MNIPNHAKEIADLIKKYSDQYLHERIVKLREEIVQLREDNLSLREDAKALNDSNDISSRLRRDGNCDFLDDDIEKEGHRGSLVGMLTESL